MTIRDMLVRARALLRLAREFERAPAVEAGHVFVELVARLEVLVEDLERAAREPRTGACPHCGSALEGENCNACRTAGGGI